MIKPSAFLNCLFGPKLLKIYAASGLKAGNYSPTTTEKFGDAILRLIDWSLYIGIYTSPLIIGILYRKNYFTSEGLHGLLKLAGYIAFLTASSLAIRAYGRHSNPIYVSFIEKYKALSSKQSSANRELSKLFDYEFSHWPVDYSIPKNRDRNSKYLDLEKPNSVVESVAQMLGKGFGYLVAHSFGIRMLYPGTILQSFIEPHLIEGRSKMIEEEGAERYKLVTQDGNTVDAIFIDRRKKQEHEKGKYLVVCCEGNAGFYEVGMISTPMDAGYSVLGWNHPGFGGSTGLPFPEEERNAVDTVMQFAINSLGFPVDHIVIYGWSIGGFSASWAAMNYPDIRALMLDATFDNIFHLAAAVMPASWNVLVDVTVRHHLNLNVAKQLEKYRGPVLLFRRTRDEVISLNPGEVGTNRGNELLLHLLKARYPHVVDDSTIPALHEWLKTDHKPRDNPVRTRKVSGEKCALDLQEHLQQNPDESYPLSIGEGWSKSQKNQFALFLAERYLWDFETTHCTLLPVQMFQLPQERSKELYIFKL